MINDNLEAQAKLIYDYWFNQYEFPNEDGKPYKSSNGNMAWNKTFKGNLPSGWQVGNLYDIADFINGLACQKYRPLNDTEKLPVIKIGEMHDGFTDKTEFARSDVPVKNRISNGDILFSWSATLEVMFWNKGSGILNQHIFKVLPKNYPKHYVYQQVSAYVINFVKMAETRKTTMGHITTDHLKQSVIKLPPKELVEKYEKMVSPIFKEITNLSIENQKLKSIRGYLLPLLMNGQIVIK